ncbi:Type I transmembrane sorting receptor [Mortierella sp. AD011]|nr:Type I transmembrane sorting receptor [Mortierella sp. AD011]
MNLYHSDVWFSSTPCKAAACTKHTRFDYTASSTFQRVGQPWVTMYGDNSAAAGVLASDIVDIGDVSVRQTSVKAFIDNAIAANILAQPAVSAFLPSVRLIGESRYTGSLRYVPVTKKGYWKVHISDVKVTGTSTGVSLEGVINTCTTLTIMGNVVVAQLYKSINGATYSSSLGGWLIPCSLGSSSESISFTMGGRDYQVSLTDLAWAPVIAGSSTCFYGIQVGEDDLWILGDIFIKNNYCVFDHSADPSITIAPLKY